MYLPSLHPISNSDFYVSGNVNIHPSAAIAPGVLLQADPESQIIIAAGVCVGMGTILHAHQGILEVESGANIGTGVLIVGKSKIGTNACIGSMTTILNSDLGRGEVVPPGSLIGDASRQSDQKPEATTTLVFESSSNHQVSEGPAAVTTPDESSLNQQAPELAATVTQVYGQASLNRLLSTLLPHRQSLNRPLQDDQSNSNSS
jgi:carbon dioxide concentrating mechanism protein CcmN